MKNSINILLTSNVIVILSSVVAIFMATTVIFIRKKMSENALTIKKILLPPLFMSTGALMYISPLFRLTTLEIMESIGLGIFFSIFIISTTKFKVRDNAIYLIPSKLFIIVLISVLIIRTIIKFILGSVLSYGTLSGMFFLLALVMIMCWRMAMLFKYLTYKKN